MTSPGHGEKNQRSIHAHASSLHGAVPSILGRGQPGCKGSCDRPAGWVPGTQEGQQQPVGRRSAARGLGLTNNPQRTKTNRETGCAHNSIPRRQAVAGGSARGCAKFQNHLAPCLPPRARPRPGRRSPGGAAPGRPRRRPRVPRDPSCCTRSRPPPPWPRPRGTQRAGWRRSAAQVSAPRVCGPGTRQLAASLGQPQPRARADSHAERPERKRGRPPRGAGVSEARPGPGRSSWPGLPPVAGCLAKRPQRCRARVAVTVTVRARSRTRALRQ